LLNCAALVLKLWFFSYRDPEFETIQLHGGHSPDPITHARAVPIFQTTSFTFENSQVRRPSPSWFVRH
jgi:cystathionine beta-lyase/cystathionine gamma-synthase